MLFSRYCVGSVVFLNDGFSIWFGRIEGLSTLYILGTIRELYVAYLYFRLQLGCAVGNGLFIVQKTPQFDGVGNGVGVG